MLLCTRVSVKFANATKKDNICSFISEYRIVCQEFINLLWELDEIPKLISGETTKKVNTWLTARMVQCCAKQASAIVRGVRTKQNSRSYTYKKLLEANLLQQARRLKKIIDTVKISKPQLKDLQPELDQRFIKVGLDNNTLFDGWIKLTCIGRGIILHIPFKRTTHFNEMMIKGKLKPGIRISNKAITFNFEITNPVERTDGKIVGLDIGIKNIFTTSDGQISQNDSHGWNLDKIQQKLSRRKKGSKGFRKAQEHRKNHTNWSINRLNLNGVKTLRFEKIINLRRGYRSSRYLSHWTYAAIFGKLVSVCSKHGVRVERVDPAYTSQRCSQCGWVRKSNRKGNRFRCTACGFISDADRNASCNIALELPRKRRSQHSNRTGFYWNVASQEPIVPDARKVN